MSPSYRQSRTAHISIIPRLVSLTGAYALLISLMLPSMSLASKKTKRIQPKNLSTNIRFSGSDVKGKYQTPGEALASVENEKKLMSLIEPRYEFKDRLKKSATQR